MGRRRTFRFYSYSEDDAPVPGDVHMGARNAWRVVDVRPRDDPHWTHTWSVEREPLGPHGGREEPLQALADEQGGRLVPIALGELDERHGDRCLCPDCVRDRLDAAREEAERHRQGEGA